MSELHKAYNNHKVIIAMSVDDSFVPVMLTKLNEDAYSGESIQVFRQSIGGSQKTMLQADAIVVDRTSDDGLQVSINTIQKLLD